MSYRDVLQSVVRGFGEASRILANSPLRFIPFQTLWRTVQPFSDTVEALRQLESRYQLAAISITLTTIFSLPPHQALSSI